MNSVSKLIPRLSLARPRPVLSSRPTPSSSRLSSTSTFSTPSPSDLPPPPDDSHKTHYLVTLLRSPLHLPAPILASCQSLGLTHRLSSSIVPISPENAGFILRVKELVGVRSVGVEEVAKAQESAWREREGEGRRGSGLSRTGAERGVIRVGRERARGVERGFKVVEK